MNREDTGIVISLAYPEEFVAMIPAWYQKPLEWIGMVNDNQACVGHSAMALIDANTGDIYYADFGRYITAFGMGRTRTRETDPDVRFEIRAEIDEGGKVLNEEEIVRYIDAHPEKTHGAGPLYASFAYRVNYNRCMTFIKKLNRKGSIIYDPFGKGRSNCSRFVFDALQAGLNSDKLLRIHKRGNIVTPSPLGNVFYSTEHKKVYKAENGVVEAFNHKRKFRFILRHFFIKPSASLSHAQAGVSPGTGYQWLGGVGDGSWFKLSAEDDGLFLIRKTAEGKEIFNTMVRASTQGFDPGKEFTLVHDCNALWADVLQGDNRYRLNAVAVA